MAVQIQVRRGTASQWTSANPTLANGELAHETDTGKLKIGDGSTAWSSLAYFTAGSGDITGVDITAGDGLDITQSGTTSGDYTATVSADLKANGGLVIETTELAIDLAASSITNSLPSTKVSGLGTAAVADTGTGSSNVILGNDARLTDDRDPNAHSADKVTSGTLGVDRIPTLSLSKISDSGTAAGLAVGISNTNVLQADANVLDDDFLRVAGTKVEGRSASETLSDIGAAAASHNHAAGDITSGTLAVARGGTGLTSLSTLLNSNQAYSDISGTPTLGTAAPLAVGISNTNVLQADANVADDDFLRVAGTKIEGRTAAETLSDIGAAAAAHNQSATTITSGTLAVARGGTGVTSLPMVTIPGAADAAAARVVLGVTNVGSYTGQIETAADKTYTIDPGAATDRTISGFYIKSASGTVTATLKVGTAVVKAASVTDSTGDQTSLANTSVSANDVLTLVCSSNSSALDVIFAVEYTE